MSRPVFPSSPAALRTLARAVLLGATLLAALPPAARAQGNLEISTPAVAAVRASMQARFAQLEPLLASGAVGLTQDGRIELRDANLVPLAQRAGAGNLVAAENADRVRLYREIAVANGHPEWEADIRNTFAQRWIDKARPGWWVRTAQGGWAQR